MINHIAIDIALINFNPKLKSQLLEGQSELLPYLKGKKGVNFSTDELERFIKEEVIHDSFTLTSTVNRSLLTLSSGERKKALLEHQLKSNPDFIIIENPFDALDVASVQFLKEHLENLSKSILIVQIFNRKIDILGFINEIITMQSGSLLYTSTEQFLKSIETSGINNSDLSIPKPYLLFDEIPNELIRFKNVSVSYGDRIIVKNINWTIKKGEFWELRGKNGSGKTTLLTMINGDNPKAFGQDIFVFGKLKGTGESVWDIKQKIGYFTPAMMDLFKGRHSALNMIISGLKDSIGLYKISSNSEVHLAEQWLGVIGLLDRKNDKYCNLNENQKRLVLIARSMIKHPPLLILDEPTVGLDDENAVLFAQLINKIASEGSTAILYVSHRKEKGLNPSHVFELVEGINGSEGIVS